MGRIKFHTRSEPEEVGSARRGEKIKEYILRNSSSKAQKSSFIPLPVYSK